MRSNENVQVHDLGQILHLRNTNEVRNFIPISGNDLLFWRIRKPLSPKELDDKAPFLQYASWSPDGTAVVFVYNNDIYYKPKVEKDLVCRITNTGKQNILYNGVPDWLYENEILRTSHTVWFSPNSLYLLYITFNDTAVGEYKYPWYESNNPKITYPKVKSFRFPTVRNL